MLLADDEDEEMLSELRELDGIVAGMEASPVLFNEVLFSSIVKKVTPVSNDEVSFILLGNLTLTERLTL